MHFFSRFSFCEWCQSCLVQIKLNELRHSLCLDRPGFGPKTKGSFKNYVDKTRDFFLIKVKEFLHKCQNKGGQEWAKFGQRSLWTLPDRPERKTWLQMPNDSKWLPNQLWNTPVISKLSCLTHSKSGSLLCPPSFFKHTHWKMVVSVWEFSIWRKKCGKIFELK